MSQTFEPRVELVVKLVVIAALAAVLGWVFMLVSHSRQAAHVDAALAQPIPFSHKHHVGDIGLDCRLCHATVETQAAPGMPSAQVCLTCHSQLFADQAMFEPLKRSNESGRPIGWAHVNRLPDYVYFDHSVHIAKNVACIECHGRVDQMPLISKPQALEMKWCMACHEDPAPHLHPRRDVFSMQPAALSRAEHEALARQAHLEPRARRTDCSTCHR